MKIADRAVGPVLMLFGALVIWGALRLPQVPGVRFGADLLPMAAGAALVLFGVLILRSGLREGAVPDAKANPGAAAEPKRSTALDLSDWAVPWRMRAAALWALGGLAAGTVLFRPLGFPLFALIFTVGLMALMGARWRIIAIIAPIFVLLLHLAFAGLMRVSLPAGPLEGILP